MQQGDDESFATRLGDFGSRIAVVAGDHELTYSELADQADELAARLGDGRRLVLLRARNDLGSLLGYLGALRAGHVVLLAGAGNAAHVEALREAWDPDTVATGDGVGCEVEVRRASSVHSLHPDLALLLSTSGSTGSPKLVRLSHGNLAANADAIATYLGLAAEDRAITSLPMHYCYGLSVVNSHLVAGASVVLTEHSVVAPCFWEAFAAHGVTNFAGVPYTFELLDRIGFESMSLPTLRHVTQAGGRLAPERVSRYAALGRRRGWRLFVMYGQTEATARMAYLPPEHALSHPDCIGVPVPGGTFDIVPVDGWDDGRGELVYRGPNVMLGYATQPADLASGAAVDALHTGDIAERTPEGLYRVVGRRSRFVKLFGLRVDLDDLERILGNVAVEAVCVDHDERVVVAFEATADDDLVRSTIRDRLGLPTSVVHVVAGAVLRLANGKPDYDGIRRQACARDDVVQAGRVADLYAAVLRRDQVRDDDTFVGLGGDSLSYVEMSVALEELLGRLPPNWPTMSVGDLEATSRQPTWTARMEANVVLRAVAVVLVVAVHAKLFSVEGGAHTLLAVAGFDFARFQLVSGRMVCSIARIAVPSMAWIGAMAATRDDFGLPHALLVNGFLGDPDARWGYWYVEALVQLLIVLALVLSVRQVRGWERRSPWRFAAVVLAVGLLVRFDALGLPDMAHPTARPHEVLWLFAVGWLAALSTSTWQRASVSIVAAVAVHGFFVRTLREMVVLAGVLLLVWVPYVRVVRPLNRVVAAVAGASLHIYLTHWAVYPPLQRLFSPAVATVGAVVVGVAVAAALSARRGQAIRRGVAAPHGDVVRRSASGRGRTPVPGLLPPAP